MRVVDHDRVGVGLKHQGDGAAADAAEHAAAGIDADFVITKRFHFGGDGARCGFFLPGITLNAYQVLRESQQLAGKVFVLDDKFCHVIHLN